MQTLFWSIEKHKIKTDFFHSHLFVCFFIALFFHVNNPIMLIFCKLSELQFRCEKDKQHEANSCFSFWIRLCECMLAFAMTLIYVDKMIIFDLSSVCLVLHCAMHIASTYFESVWMRSRIVMSFPAAYHFYRWLKCALIFISFSTIQ